MSDYPPYDSRIVANSFIKIAKDEGKVLQHMKLQKLVYIAHCWYVLFKEKRLVSDRIEAWTYGPVIPEMYHEFKTYGSRPISGFYVRKDPQSGKDVIPFVCEDDMNFLRVIWKEYGRYTGEELSALTHSSSIPGEKTPWQIVYEQHQELLNRGGKSRGPIIEDSLIIEHYEKLLERASAS